MYIEKLPNETAVYAKGNTEFLLARVLSPGLIPGAMLNNAKSYFRLLADNDWLNTPPELQSPPETQLADIHFIKPTEKLLELYAIVNELGPEEFYNVIDRMQGRALIGFKALNIEVDPAANRVGYDYNYKENDEDNPLYFEYAGGDTITLIAEQEIYGFTIIERGYGPYSVNTQDPYKITITGPNLQAFISQGYTLGYYVFLKNAVV